MRLLHYMVAALVLLASVAQAQVICPGEQPCPVGYHETAVNCKACILDGYVLTRPTDTEVCKVGFWVTPDQKQCCPDGTILKSDGMCCVVNESDPCSCAEGWHLVAPFKCCPDGKFLAGDNPDCCVAAGATCCEPGRVWRLLDQENMIGRCVPQAPQGVVTR